jgi:hypothetical protein
MWKIQVILSEEVNSQYMKSFDGFVCEINFFLKKHALPGDLTSQGCAPADTIRT